MSGYTTAKRVATITATVLLSAGLIAGCSGQKKTPPTQASQAPASSASTTGIDPLTGTEVPVAVLNQPVLSVKIPNGDYINSNATPQWGLDKADIVYEELVEGGITRLAAQFHTNVPKIVGPTRSIRPMDPAIVAPAGGIIAYSGGQHIFQKMIKATGLKLITERNTNMVRTSERVAPNNLLLNARAVHDQNIGKLDGPGKLFEYATTGDEATPATSGTPVSKVTTNFSIYSPRYWKWSEQQQTWLRWQDPRTYGRSANKLVKHTAHDGQQINATNLVVLRVKINLKKYAAAKYRSHGLVPYTELFGSGKAWIGVDGKGMTATWKKAKDVHSPLQLLTDDGQPVKLAPGKTWVELVPTSGAGVKFKVSGGSK